MLDRFKLIKQITGCADSIQNIQDDQVALALNTWKQVVCEPGFAQQLLQAKVPWSLPSWNGSLDQVFQFNYQKINYTVVASDGSQIYPDRHMGSSYYLINTGVVILRYSDHSSASFISEPYFFTDFGSFEGGVTDYIDSKRHELEIRNGLIAIMQEQAAKNNSIAPLIYLADGSLIAWHLFGKSDDLSDQFMPTYFKQLQDFYMQKISFMGYVSLPNSKELVNVLRAKLCDFTSQSKQVDLLDKVTDADFLINILQPMQFTTWFKSNVAAIKCYPEPLRPYFAYLHTGNEIARVECPAWIVQDNELLKNCMQIVIDQVIKGYGYPVCLSEAHQQAVIKSVDRDFFYQVVNQITRKADSRACLSRKLRQKQVMHF